MKKKLLYWLIFLLLIIYKLNSIDNLLPIFFFFLISRAFNITDNMNQKCKVCGEPAAGFHFGAFTCEGCKVWNTYFICFDYKRNRIRESVNKDARLKSSSSLLMSFVQNQYLTADSNTKRLFLIKMIHNKYSKRIIYAFNSHLHRYLFAVLILIITTNAITLRKIICNRMRFIYRFYRAYTFIINITSQPFFFIAIIIKRWSWNWELRILKYKILIFICTLWILAGWK